MTVAKKLKPKLVEIGEEYLAELVNKVRQRPMRKLCPGSAGHVYKRQLISAAQRIMEMGFDE